MGRAAVRRALVLAVAVLALAPWAAAQILTPSPRPLTGGPQDLPPAGLEDYYGPPEPEDLDQIAYNGASYQKRHVMVKGRLDLLEAGRYLSLNQGAARVMLIPFSPTDVHDYSTLLGMEVDVRGIVRMLPAQQKMVPCQGTVLLESKCDDPLLPELPDARIDWPPASITVLSLSDRGTGLAARRSGARTLAETGVEAAAADGKPVRALGQFRGANLCRDLPGVSRRDPADWVLLTSEGALWVVGRRPAGKGFQLDPAYRADTSRWLEVSGKVQIADSVKYLKASKVSLIPRPAETEHVPCPP
jgi:hypothetical protein